MATDSIPKTTREFPHRPDRAFRYSRTANETACEAVYTAVATVEDCSALDLEPLGETVDPDALNALFPSAKRNGQRHLTLRYYGYELVIAADEITVLSVQ